jgi:hypothetical protein
LALYLALRLAIVTFWALFLGPEPLSCWIFVMDDEYSGFQVLSFSASLLLPAADCDDAAPV